MGNNENHSYVQPNYIIIINWFWTEVPFMKGYKPLYGILFFALLDSINKNSWRPTLIDFDRILNKARITAGPYNEGRKWLMENNLIDFVPGKNAYQMASFSIGLAIRNLTGKPITKHTASGRRNVTSDAHSNIHLPVSNSKHINNKTGKHKTSFAPNVNVSFEQFWILYDKQVGDKAKLEKKWSELTDQERQDAIDHIPKYIAAQPNKRYRKDPETYLDNKSFNDEIINENASSEKPSICNGKASEFRGRSAKRDAGLLAVARDLAHELRLDSRRSQDMGVTVSAGSNCKNDRS